ncbi:MAG: DUF72 domain-containing protein, partial [Myxococcales bacterium]|nr:DUF72 domain-containing protein [Myxococcales bacterium]
MAKRTAGEAQLDLFGGGEGSPASNDGAGDDEAAWDHRRALAARVPAYVHLGTSSWTFPGWAGLVYRRRYPTKAAFTHGALLEYAAHPLFRTVCLDR